MIINVQYKLMEEREMGPTIEIMDSKRIMERLVSVEHREPSRHIAINV